MVYVWYHTHKSMFHKCTFLSAVTFGSKQNENPYYQLVLIHLLVNSIMKSKTSKYDEWITRLVSASIVITLAFCYWYS